MSVNVGTYQVTYENGWAVAPQYWEMCPRCGESGLANWADHGKAMFWIECMKCRWWIDAKAPRSTAAAGETDDA